MHRLRPRNTTALPLVAFLLGSLLLAGTGCASLSNTEKGAATGAGAGAAAGAVIGEAASDDAAKGAIVGGVVGGAAGAVIGEQMDKQAEELDQELDSAEVTKVENPETGQTAGIEITFDSALLFDFDSSQLRSPARQDLSDLSGSLEEYPETDVLVVGHTDAIGSANYNQTLSERRARAAAGYLLDRGVGPRRVTTLGKGESEPVASNDTEYGRQQNRRVEIAIYASEEQREAAARSANRGTRSSR
jgi:outer membrane protein OmpA-like peptidoglycan-associated protein